LDRADRLWKNDAKARLNAKSRTCMRLVRLALIASAVLASPRTVQDALAQSPSPLASSTHTRLEIPPQLAQKLGQKIWSNETHGDLQQITAWNDNEDFMSLGIGHFIWFPAARPKHFQESFPAMLAFLRRQKIALPRWLDQEPIPPCPWNDKSDFAAHLNSPEMVELREFLKNTFAAQTQFLIFRMRESLPKILATLDNPEDREHVRRQFYRVARNSADLYPLVDFVNFKGEGIAPAEAFTNKETGLREGWGLKQVLLEMSGTANDPSALDEFADAAKSVLKRRIGNRPSDAIYAAGWFARCDTYRQALR
jgi:hypothetical protein